MLTAVPEEEAVTPMLDKALLALTAEVSPEAIEVSVSVDSAVYETLVLPPDRLWSVTVRVSTSPVVFEPPIAATCHPYVGVVKERLSVAVDGL